MTTNDLAEEIVEEIKYKLPEGWGACILIWEGDEEKGHYSLLTNISRSNLLGMVKKYCKSVEN